MEKKERRGKGKLGNGKQSGFFSALFALLCASAVNQLILN
jgi:hypothetical protein